MVSQTNKVLEAVIKAGRVGSWSFVEQLGSGGFGLVIKARRKNIDGSRQEAAIKLLAHDRAMTADAMALFNHEFNVLKRLDSPYIAAVLDSGMDIVNLGRGVTADVQWIATEHIKGDDLRQEIKAHGPLDKAQWLEFAHDLLSAVEVAHAASVIHRDIKPDNIMRLSRKSVLIDFGGASFEAELDPGDRYVTYTPGFAAPEQLDGSNPEHLTAAADMFAVGCLLHFAATGGSPWGDEWKRTQDPAAAWYKTISRELPDLDALDDEQRELISMMLVFSESERISSSDALAEIEGLLPDSSSRSSHGKGYSSSRVADEVELDEVSEDNDFEPSEKEPDAVFEESPEVEEAPRPATKRATGGPAYSTKSFSTALTLATWLGFFGAHRFYLGKGASAVAQLLTSGGYLFWWVSDVNKLLRGEFTDGDGLKLKVSEQELAEARKDRKRNVWFLLAFVAFLIIVGQSGNKPEPTPSSSTIQNVIGMNLNDATALFPDVKIDEVDALGTQRSVFLESNWKVCDQSPKSGNLNIDETLTLNVVKLEETCP